MGSRTQYICLLPVCALLMETSAPAAMLPAQAQVIYVDRAAAGADSGTSWLDAFTDLHSALLVAADGDQVWIAAGEYRTSAVNDPADTFLVTKAIGLYGGFRGVESRIQDRDPFGAPTVLEGQLQTGNAQHVVTVDTASAAPVLLDRLLIEQGRSGQGRDGGGVLIAKGAVSVRNCVFRFNEGRQGGAIYCAANASLEVVGCRFENNSAHAIGGAIHFAGRGGEGLRVAGTTFVRNTASGEGGAIYASHLDRIEESEFALNSSGYAAGALAVYQRGEGRVLRSDFVGNQTQNWGGAAQISNIAFTDVRFQSNTASSGGAVSATGNVHFDECRLIENRALSGGAIVVQRWTSVGLLRSVLQGNQATGGGGAIYSVGGGQNGGGLKAAECRFLGNSCGNSGGAILFQSWRLDLSNCLFDLNSAGRGGGAIYMPGAISNQSTLVNLTFVRNTTAGHGGAIEIGNDFVYDRAQFVNSIFWDNADRIGTGEFSQLSRFATRVKYCAIQGHSSRGGVGNTGQDPWFVDPGNGDFHLKDISPLIDAGDPVSRRYLLDTRGRDLDGEIRMYGTAVDIGADEMQ